MSFPKEAQRKGGKTPASDRQKQVALQTIRQAKPWLLSTGPSPLGKLAARYNAVKPGIYRRFVKSWKEDFERGCQEAEAAIAEFERDRCEHQDLYSELKVRRFQGQSTNGDCWCLFVVYATFIGHTHEIDFRVEKVKEIRERYNSEKKIRYVSLLLGGDPLILRLLEKAKEQCCSANQSVSKLGTT